MNILFILLILICSTGCDKKTLMRLTSYEPSNKSQCVNEINHRAVLKIKEKYGLRPFGEGSQMMHQIEMLCLAFQYNQLVDIEGARRLLISAAVAYLEEINAHKEVRPYLNNYPFKLEDVRIELYPRNPDGSTPAVGELVIAVLSEGHLRYEVDVTTEPAPSKTVLEETLEEALAKLEEEKHNERVYP